MDPYQSPKSKSQYSDGGTTSGLLLFERAVQELTRHWKTLFAASAAPILISSFIQLWRAAYFQSFLPGVDSFLTMWFVALGMFWISVPFFVMLATSCHRIVLLGEESLPNRFGLYWSWNETRFMGWLFVLGIIGALASIPAYVLMEISDYLDFYVLPSWPLAYLAVIFSTYFDGRFGLVLPATAVGKHMRLVESWRATRRVGWAIFFALLIPIAISEVIEIVLFRELISSTSLFVYFFQTMLFYPLIAIGVAILTIVYRDYGQDAP